MTYARVISRRGVPEIIAKIFDGYAVPKADLYRTEKGHFFISHPEMSPSDVEAYAQGLTNYPFGSGVLYLPPTPKPTPVAPDGDHSHPPAP